MTTTAYLDLFLRSVHEPALLQTFLSFILMHKHDHVHVLDTLVSRVNTPFQVTRRDMLGWGSSRRTSVTWRVCPSAGHGVPGSLQDSDRPLL